MDDFEAYFKELKKNFEHELMSFGLVMTKKLYCLISSFGYCIYFFNIVRKLFVRNAIKKVSIRSHSLKISWMYNV